MPAIMEEDVPPFLSEEDATLVKNNCNENQQLPTSGPILHPTTISQLRQHSSANPSSQPTKVPTIHSTQLKTRSANGKVNGVTTGSKRNLVKNISHKQLQALINQQTLIDQKVQKQVLLQ